MLCFTYIYCYDVSYLFEFIYIIYYPPVYLLYLVACCFLISSTCVYYNVPTYSQAAYLALIPPPAVPRFTVPLQQN